MASTNNIISGLILSGLLGGCAVGPDYRAPDAIAPESFHAVGNTAAFDATQEKQFWRGFDDPLLAQLIQQSLDANYNLQAAVARYERAAALLRLAKREQLPGVTASASAGEQRPSMVEDPSRVRRNHFEAGVVLEWELDLFGRLSRASEAELARFNATEADLGALQVSMVGQLASSYFELRGLQQQLEVAIENTQNQEQSLAIVNARLNAGRGTEFDRVRAEAQLSQTRAEIPALEAAVRTRMHRIAVLSGKEPAALIDQLQAPVPLPQNRPQIPAGTPAALLRRRPDIRAAEQRFAAATADVGVASADMFPRFTLGALLGSLATDGSDLFTGATESRSVALGIDWTFLNAGRVKARIDAAGANARAALADYQQTVLSALEETESGLVQFQRSQQRAQQLELASAAAQKAAKLARTRYQEGLIGYFEVLDAEREANAARSAEMEGRTREALAMVEVYRALAGAPAAAPHYVRN